MRAFIVLLKEFTQIRRNSFLPKLIVAFPVIVMLIAPLLMTMDVRNVNVAVVDLDRSTTSHRIVSHIKASEYLSFVGATAEFDLALRDLEKGKVDVIVQIPNYFERDMAVATAEKISITANAVNAIKALIGTQYLVQTIARTVVELRGEKTPNQLSELVTVQNRFNPTLNYRHYMIPAPAIMIYPHVRLFACIEHRGRKGNRHDGTDQRYTRESPYVHFVKAVTLLDYRHIRAYDGNDCCASRLWAYTRRFCRAYLLWCGIVYSDYFRSQPHGGQFLRYDATDNVRYVLLYYDLYADERTAYAH